MVHGSWVKAERPAAVPPTRPPPPPPLAAALGAGPGPSVGNHLLKYELIYVSSPAAMADAMMIQIQTHRSDGTWRNPIFSDMVHPPFCKTKNENPHFRKAIGNLSKRLPTMFQQKVSTELPKAKSNLESSKSKL